MTILSRIALAALLLAGTASLAAQHHGTHEHHAHGAPKSAVDDATRAYSAVNDKMHRDMAIEYSGDADVDFVRGMIPHHQGAIDMAEVVLKHGTDPNIRRLAEEIIKAQKEEIAQMQLWLRENAEKIGP
jgi:uncharacterized protein (DUF305 family)